MTLVFHYVIILFEGLHMQKVRQFCFCCDFMGFLDCQIFICNRVICIMERVC
jgi:hypothetical protein